MTNEYRLSVVICAIDETDLLQTAFSKIYAEAEDAEYLFVLSRNCSPACLAVVKGIVAAHPSCSYRIQTAYGFGNALQDSFGWVSGTHHLVWAADDGMDINAFKKMLPLSRQNPDSIVKVSRWLPGGGFVNYGAVRTVINHISQKMFAFLYHSDLTDYTNPTQIAPLSLYQSLRYENQDASFLPEVIFKPLKLGYRFIEVPCMDVSKSKSHIRFFTLCKYYLVIAKIRFTPAKKFLKEK